MTKDEALKLALEALERCVATCFDQYAHEQVMGRPEHFVNQTITALNETLAQPEQEPVGKFAKFTDGIWREVTEGSAGLLLYTATEPPPWGFVDLAPQGQGEDDDTQVYAADTAIVNTLLPKLYSIIDRLLDGQDKALVIEARRVLPKAYKNSFEKGKGV